MNKRNRPRLSSASPALYIPAALLLLAGAAGAVAPPEAAAHRDFDARVALTESLDAQPRPAQRAAAEELRRAVPELAVTYDATTGATRTLSNRVGYLTDTLAEADAEAAALAFARANLDLLGLTAADLDGYEVTDRVYSRVSGATHLYLRQTYRGLPLYNGQLHFNINRDGRLLSVNNAFLPGLAAAVNTTTPALDTAAAVASALDHAGLALADLADEPALDSRLMLLPIRRGEARLVWNFQLHTRDQNHVYDFTVDAVSGQVWTRFDQVDDAEYTVYPQPIESPIHTTPLPPSDARVVEVDPDADFPSGPPPFGWHDTDGTAGAEFTIHRGNNVHAYEDTDNNGAPPAVEPDCGAALECNFAIDLTMAPSASIPAAVANLFYWNNIIHDVQYEYGFDEAGGNFQVTNFSGMGSGGDDVRAEGQDGGGNCNANFFTPSDGSRPRMQMYTCNRATPSRDGDLDAGVIVHEYGHGISNRQVGGPGNSNCLNNSQQPGEGLSDWWALAYTAEAGHTSDRARGIASYLFNLAAVGGTIRGQPYSTDPAVNTWTYSSIGGMSIPHGVGSVWAQGAWEAYWALVDRHGFGTDLYDAAGGFGNQRAMLYVNEAMKIIPCSPTFIDVRDGILQAAVDNYSGEDVCTLWQAFADFGLGEDASTPGPNSTTATDGFAIPAACLTVHADGFESGDCTAWSSNTGGC